jgi:O-antigen/teichoic acid export membrane protein
LKEHISFYTREVKSVANKGFFYLFTVQGFIIVIGFTTQFFVAGILDPTDIGRIKIMQTYINLAVLICGLGFETSLLKLAAENIIVEQKKRLYQTAFLVTLISFVVLYLILCLISWLDLVSQDQIISRLFPLYMLFLLPLTLQNIQLAYYQAEKKIRLMAKLQLIVKTLSILVIVAFTILYKFNGYIISIVLTGFIACVIFELGIKNIRSSISYFSIDYGLLKKMWRIAGFAMLANLVGLLAATIDVYLINYMVVDRHQVGYYMFALTIVSVFQLLPVTIQQIAFPFFSQHSSIHEKWYTSYTKYNKLNHLLVLAFVASGVLLFPPLVRFIFSGKYDGSIFYFIFLSFAWTIKTSNVIKSTAIMGYGRFDLNLMISLIVLITSIPVYFLLIHYWGLVGAVVGSCISAVISYLTVTLFFRRFNKSLKGDLRNESNVS